MLNRFVLCCTLLACMPVIAEEGGKPAREPHGAPDFKLADWDLINFRWDPDYKIKQIKIEIREGVGMRFRDGKVVQEAIVADVKTLKEFENAFHTARMLVPSRSEGGIGLGGSDDGNRHERLLHPLPHIPELA